MDTEYKIQRAFNIVKGQIVFLLGVLLLYEAGYARPLAQDMIGRAQLMPLELAYEKANEGQERLLSVKFNDELLEDALKQLAKKARVGISYRPDLLSDKRVTYTAENESVFNVLEAVLDKTGLYGILSPNKKVILIKKYESNSFDVIQETVTGTVTDATTGETLPGVNVLVKGTSTGTATDVNGTYELTVESLQDTLVFSFIGFQTQEVPLDGRTDIDVTLQSQAISGDELVVVGYGVQRKESVVGAISTVQGENIIQSPTPNVTQTLAGRIPGVSAVQTSGEPGSNASQILIRGQSTFGNASPIVIVDGIERSDFGNIDPHVIESINVLKDASATAVYGIRGANGVIVVTTKSGNRGRPVISYSANFGMQSLSGIPQTLSAHNAAFLKNEALFNDGLPIMFTSEELQKFKDGSDPVWYPNVNWYEEVTRDYFLQSQHNINVSGGTDLASYFVSLGYTFEDGMTKDYGSDFKGFKTTNNFQRFNFRSNIDFNLSDNLQLSVNVGGIFGEAYAPGNFHFGGTGFVIQKLMVIPSYAMPVEIPGVGYTAAPNVGENLLSPIGQLRGTSFRMTENNRYESTVNLDYNLNDVIQGFSFRGTFSYDSHNNIVTEAHANPTTLYDIVDRRNQIYQKSPIWSSDNYSFDVSNNINSGLIDMNMRASLNYSGSFGSHNLTGLLLGTRQILQNTGTDAVNAMEGLAGRIAYDYDTRYFIEFNIGYNGSENFAKENRYAYFPALAIGYDISNEAFMSGVEWLDLLKVKGSYGLVGNDQIGQRFLFLNGYGTEGEVQFGDPNSIVNYPVTTQTRIGNPDVSWETGIKRNIGLEMMFFNGMLDITVDLFDEHRKDILVANPQSRLTQYGQSYPPVNVGEVYNKGIEVETNFRHNIGDDFQYGFRGMFSFARNEVLDIDEPFGRPDYQKQEGKRINQYIGYVTDGFYDSVEDIENSPTNLLGTPIPGDLKYVDTNGDGQIDPDDRVPIGHSNRPEINYSFTPNISWKGFSLEVMFQGVANVSSHNTLDERNAGQQMYDFMLNRWTPQTAETATWPALHSTGNAFISYRLNDFILQDASYLKIRNAELSWHLPYSVVNNLGFSSLRVYVNGQNLYTWTPYRFGFDPEVQGGYTFGEEPSAIGRGNWNYPLSRVINFGFNVKF